MIGSSDQVLIWIEDPAGAIYRITRKSGSRFLHEGPAGKQVCSKTGTGFTYQLLTHMVKMEPERFTIIIDHGKELLGINHMPVLSQDFILFLHRQRIQLPECQGAVCKPGKENFCPVPFCTGRTAYHIKETYRADTER
jgi:hypothetical protein